jgi:phosphoribosylanthranilate isomerase
MAAPTVTPHDQIQVKICGITNLADAQVAIEAGADLIGFIFYPKSPRYVAPEAIRDWGLGTGDWGSGRDVDSQSPVPSPQSPVPKFVGVFVDEDPARVAEIIEIAGLDFVQLHGAETTEILAGLSPRAFKALRPASADQAEDEADHFAPFGAPDGPQLMVDAYDPNHYGGTGKKADWNVAAAIAQRVPRLLLAGGLTPVNVADAVRTVRPWGVDVSSGVELSPGRKDHDAVRAFITAAKGALS